MISLTPREVEEGGRRGARERREGTARPRMHFFCLFPLFFLYVYIFLADLGKSRPF